MRSLTVGPTISPVQKVTRSILAPCTISPNFLRLLAATVVGTVIGINRDLYGKPTGVRLHALVSIASALLVMLAGELGSGMPDHAAASRIIQGIVGGIGFLGAGVILRADKGNRVYHITTAATI